MQSVPHKDRLDFYKYLNAIVSFEKVSEICNYIENNKINTSSYIYYSLSLSIAVIYARPFKQRKNIRLEKYLVPNSLISTHNLLILTRDKVFAHTDTDGLRYDGNSIVNEISLSVRDGRINASMLALLFRDTEISNIRMLTNKLAEKCSYYADKIWTKYMKKHHIDDGEYVININKNVNSFLTNS